VTFISNKSLPLYLSQNWRSDGHFEVLNMSKSKQKKMEGCVFFFVLKTEFLLSVIYFMQSYLAIWLERGTLVNLDFTQCVSWYSFNCIQRVSQGTYCEGNSYGVTSKVILKGLVSWPLGCYQVCKKLAQKWFVEYFFFN
jgi:hypothetical protein